MIKSSSIFAAILVLILSVDGAPRKTHSTKQLENENEHNYHLIDESQNGTENYRISVKDIVVIVAPEDSLLAAASLLLPQLATGLGDHFFEDDLAPPQVDLVLPTISPELEEKPSEKPTTESVRILKKTSTLVETGRSETGRSESHNERHEYPVILGPFLKRVQPKNY